MRRPLLVVVAGLLLAGAGVGAVQAVDHVRSVRRQQADEREARQAWLAKEPGRRAVRALGLPTGYAPCPQFPHAMEQWGEICWQANGSPAQAAAQVRQVFRSHGVTQLAARCSQREPGWVHCYVQGLLSGFRLAVVVSRADNGTVDGVQLHGTQVVGGIDRFWHEHLDTLPAGETGVSLPAA